MVKSKSKESKINPCNLQGHKNLMMSIFLENSTSTKENFAMTLKSTFSFSQ